MKSRYIVIFLLLLSGLGIADARERSSSSGFHQGSTREEILANRARRKKQLEALLLESRQQLADHTKGKKLLDSNDLTSLEKKIHVFQRKLDTMEGDMDEREVERILKREELRHERDEERRRRREREEL
ncbi:expressed unknown protein [Seminavis robusta]|uniref:Uncharacterized protein n=1 Tax=Seminavis robusta TaxID=568900 RepID=A0A9N8DH56_9STRA|nr:expressed unknown protein [Seminavis robusta]|eukprot:Sro143_g066470.1 n/a (129) ;mRNA; r:12478-13026